MDTIQLIYIINITDNRQQQQHECIRETINNGIWN